MNEYTREELEQLIKARTDELFAFAGGYTHLAWMLQIPSSTSQGWYIRRRVSKKGVKQVEENIRLRDAGFTAEFLRPDM